jgi:NAD(P)-dependent dehydrogenase (short-subunit alcohol dehydrogenase family)
MNDGRFAGKVVVVIGGATGIGAATVRRLAAEGARVVVGDINREGGAALAAQLGGAVSFAFVDLADEATVRALMETTAARHGGIDGVFNNAADLSAATMLGDLDPVEIDLAAFDRAVRINLRGFVLSCRHAIPLLIKRGGGAIVQTSSLAGQYGGVEPHRLAYSCSKAGIDALTRQVVARYGKAGIRCNAVAPGVVMTEPVRSNPEYLGVDQYLRDTPHVRLAEPEDIAAIVAFLLSADAAMINGQVIRADGGMSAVYRAR